MHGANAARTFELVVCARTDLQVLADTRPSKRCHNYVAHQYDTVRHGFPRYQRRDDGCMPCHVPSCLSHQFANSSDQWLMNSTFWYCDSAPHSSTLIPSHLMNCGTAITHRTEHRDPRVWEEEGAPLASDQGALVVWTSWQLQCSFLRLVKLNQNSRQSKPLSLFFVLSHNWTLVLDSCGVNKQGSQPFPADTTTSTSTTTTTITTTSNNYHIHTIAASTTKLDVIIHCYFTCAVLPSP
jgi:hypothetical protein